jgi:GntR family uxuAB operon transcriptional repressor
LELLLDLTAGQPLIIMLIINQRKLATGSRQVTALLDAKPSAAISNVWPAILDLIRERGLSPGDQLPSIRELAERLEVKQTVIRDALLKAESQGMVKVLPRAGVFLRSSSPQPPSNARERSTGKSAWPDGVPFGSPSGEHNVLHLLDARRLIEIELVGRAAERRRLEDLLPVRRALEALLQLPRDATRAEHVQHDMRFHVEIAKLGGNQVLCAVQRTLLDLLVPHLNDVPQAHQRRTVTDRSHVAIYEALVAGDAEKARQEMREHLNLAYDGLLQDLQQPPSVTAQTSNSDRVQSTPAASEQPGC